MDLYKCIDFILVILKKKITEKEPNWDVENLKTVAAEEEKAYGLIFEILPMLWW